MSSTGCGWRRDGVAQDQPRLDRAVPLVQLQAERRVEPGLAAVGQPRHAEGDGARADAAGLDGEAHVLALAHRARVDQARRRHEQHRLRVALAEGREALEVLGQVGAELAARDDRVDPRDGDQVLGRQHRGGVRLERGAERVDLRGGDRAAGGGAVAAVAQQVVRAGVQAAEQVEHRDRAPGAGPLLPVQRDDDGRAVMALGDPARDDADDARVPALAGEHVGGAVAELGDLRLGLEEDPLLGEAPLGVGGVELACDGVGALGVVGEHQLDARVGAVQPAGGVDPRGQPEADHPSVDARRVALGDAHQRAQARPSRHGERGQALAHQAPVLAGQRDTVGDGGERHQVKVDVGLVGVAARGAQQGAGELVDHRRGAQVAAGVAADRRMHDRHGGQRAVGAGLVVVGHHDVHAGGAGGGHLVHGGDRAVGGQEQARPALGQPLDGAHREAVAVLGPAGQEPVAVRAQRTQDPDQDRRRGHAVDVVVAVHRDPRPVADVAEDQRDRLVDPGEARRVVRVLALQKRPCGRRTVEPAPHQHLRERAAHPELTLEAPDVAQPTRRDLEARFHDSRPCQRHRTSRNPPANQGPVPQTTSRYPGVCPFFSAVSLGGQTPA